MTKFNSQQTHQDNQTLTDIAVTNKPERITRIYNLVISLSGHNMILTVRKLTKKWLQYFAVIDAEKIKLIIHKSKLLQLEHDPGSQNWECNYGILHCHCHYSAEVGVDLR